MEDNILVDASIMIALYYTEDTLHTEAIAFFEVHQHCRFYFLESTLREIMTVLTYRGGISFACTSIDDIYESLNHETIDDDFMQTLMFFRKLKTKISFFDAALLFYAQKFGLRLVSFDKQLNTLYTTHNNS